MQPLVSCPQRGGHPGTAAPPAPPAPSGLAVRRSHRLLRWPPFFFFFFLGGGDAELLDQCLVLGEKGRRGEGGGAAVAPLRPLPRWALTCTPGARGSRRPGSRSPPGRRPRPRARTPGPAPRPRAAAGSPPRCRRQGRSPPAPWGRAFRLPLSPRSAPRPGSPQGRRRAAPTSRGSGGDLGDLKGCLQGSPPTPASAVPSRLPWSSPLLRSHLSVSRLLLGEALPSPRPSVPFTVFLSSLPPCFPS